MRMKIVSHSTEARAYAAAAACSHCIPNQLGSLVYYQASLAVNAERCCPFLFFQTDVAMIYALMMTTLMHAITVRWEAAGALIYYIINIYRCIYIYSHM